MNNKGFTLIEVLASLVIITIVITSFLAIFVNTNKLAANNNEKLVVINLADAYLERVKIDPTVVNYNLKTPGRITVEKGNCGNSCDFISTTINDRDYDISISASQDSTEIHLKLIRLLVTVKAVGSNISSQVEGYVLYE